jgi:hypothetical protein
MGGGNYVMSGIGFIFSCHSATMSTDMQIDYRSQLTACCAVNGVLSWFCFWVILLDYHVGTLGAFTCIYNATFPLPDRFTIVLILCTPSLFGCLCS